MHAEKRGQSNVSPRCICPGHHSGLNFSWMENPPYEKRSFPKKTDVSTQKFPDWWFKSIRQLGLKSHWIENKSSDAFLIFSELLGIPVFFSISHGASCEFDQSSGALGIIGSPMWQTQSPNHDWGHQVNIIPLHSPPIGDDQGISFSSQRSPFSVKLGWNSWTLSFHILALQWKIMETWTCCQQAACLWLSSLNLWLHHIAKLQYPMALCDYGPYAASTSFGKLLDRIQQQTHVYRSAAGSLCIQQKSEEHFEPLLNQTWRQKIPRSASFKVDFSIVYNVLFLKKNLWFSHSFMWNSHGFSHLFLPKNPENAASWPRPSATCGSPPHQSLPSRRGLCLKIAAWDIE